MPRCKFSNLFQVLEISIKKKKKKIVTWIGWAQIQIVDGIKRIHSSWAGGSSPEHFEPNYRSVAACAILRQASKVLASQY